MTPAEYEWAQEQAETAYQQGRIGKRAFHKRMSALGFSTSVIKEWLDEMDADKKLLDIR